MSRDRMLKNPFEAWYVDMVEDLLQRGVGKGDRTGTGTLSTMGLNYRVDLTKDPYPILSSRKLDYKQPIVEMEGFLNAECNSNWYKERGCPYWNKFGIPEDIYDDKIKEPYELANEYCSMPVINGGPKLPPNHEIYLKRMKKLNELDVQKGTKLVTDAGVHLYHKRLKYAKGYLGPIYGYVQRNWKTPDGPFDQIEYLTNTLREDPNSRRIVVNSWEPAYLPDPKLTPAQNAAKGKMCLTPCHYTYVVRTEEIPFDERLHLLTRKLNRLDLMGITRTISYTTEARYKLFDEHDIPKYYVDLYFVMRSNDIGIGLPANIQEYCWLNMIIGKTVNMVPRYVQYNGVDCHIYTNHITQLKEVVRRWRDREVENQHPELFLESKHDNLWDYSHLENFLTGYYPLEAIKFPISV